MNERRIESRYLCADLIRVSWLVDGRQWQSADAVLEDIAARGISLQMESPIRDGTLVHVLLGKTEFEGHVCYCTFQEIGYFIGVHFDDAARWNTHIFQPQHLTSLQELADLARYSHQV